jgi:putative addiction module killer protein
VVLIKIIKNDNIEVHLKEIRFFRTETNRVPYLNWLNSLDVTTRARVSAFVYQLSLGGSKRNLKHLSQGVYELKINFGPGYRIYYMVLNWKVILLLLGGDKRTQRQDIQRALTYRRSYNAQK